MYVPSSSFATDCELRCEQENHFISLHMDYDPSLTLPAGTKSKNRPSTFYSYTWIVDVAATEGKHTSTLSLHMDFAPSLTMTAGPESTKNRPLFSFTRGLLTCLPPKENARPRFIFSHGFCSVADNDGRPRVNKPTVHRLPLHMDC